MNNEPKQRKSMQEVKIRDLRQGDIPEIVSIALEAWEPVFASFRQLLGETVYYAAFPDWPAEKERQIRSAAADEFPTEFIVAEVNDVVVAFASFVVYKRSGSAEIGNNAVHPLYQNRGIAKKLYQEIIRRVKMREITTLKVTTGLDDSHAPARAAYQAVGFSNGLPMISYYMKLI